MEDFLVMFPRDWARLPEVEEFGRQNDLTLTEAMMRLVNSGLSHEHIRPA